MFFYKVHNSINKNLNTFEDTSPNFLCSDFAEEPLYHIEP